MKISCGNLNKYLPTHYLFKKNRSISMFDSIRYTPWITPERCFYVSEKVSCIRTNGESPSKEYFPTYLILYKQNTIQQRRRMSTQKR